MKILLLHLSDMHFKSSTDRLARKSEKIVSAVRNLKADACFVVLSGDIANSGLPDQYTTARKFLVEIGQGLQSDAHSSPLEFVAIPGNHDCDFDKSISARTDVRTNAGDGDVLSQGIIDQCIELQTAFFIFRDHLHNNIRPEGDSLYYRYAFSVGGESLVFHCYNTAWISVKDEIPGTLFFPISHLPAAGDAGGVHISVLHHPFNWLSPDNARRLRQYVELTSDLILTGHEHQSDWRRQENNRQGDILFIEGGVLQDSSGSDLSTFNAIVDT